MITLKRQENIALIVPTLKRGGAERFVSRLSFMLKDFNTVVILFDDREIKYELGCPYYCVNAYASPSYPGKIINVIKRVSAVCKLKKKHNISVSVSFGDSANIINALAKRNDKVYLSIRGYQSIEDISRGWNKLLSKYLFGRADSILCVSQKMAEKFDCLYNHKYRTDILNNGYDMEEINRLAEETTEIDSWLVENQVIVTVGTLRPEKGYWHLIKSFYILHKNFPKAKLLHIGPPLADEELKLKKLIHDLKMEKHIKMIGFKANPYKYLKKCKIYVLSSIYEGFPNALVEAMACGIPVIAADCQTGPREILYQDYNDVTASAIEFADYGILVPPLNNTENYDSEVVEKEEEILAEAISLLLKDNKLASNYGQKAFHQAAYYSYEKCRDKLIDIIENS